MLWEVNDALVPGLCYTIHEDTAIEIFLIFQNVQGTVVTL